MYPNLKLRMHNNDFVNNNKLKGMFPNQCLKLAPNFDRTFQYPTLQRRS